MTSTLILTGYMDTMNVHIYFTLQDDVVMTTLTVRENLKFSADLRLDKTYNEEMKEERVQSVINQLSLGEYGTLYEGGGG